MTRVIPILLLVALSVHVAQSQKIVAGALQKIFPYAAAAKVTALTTNLNKQTAIAKSKTVVKNWVPANWKAANAKPDAKNPLSKQAYAQNKALTFIDYRYSLVKYVNYLFKQGVSSKFLTQAEANNMKKVFWAADVKAANNYTMTCGQFMMDAASLVKDSDKLMAEVQKNTNLFAKANPTDFTNLQWNL